MKVLVSGACGFIGSKLVDDLHDKGHTIVATDDVNIFNQLSETDKERFSQFQDWNNIVDNFDYSILDGVEFVFLLGANSSTRATFDELLKPNVNSPLGIVNQCKSRGIPVVFASSGAVYGSRFVLNQSAINPLTMYGLTKLMLERWIDALRYDNVVCLRYHNVYGEGEKHKGNMASIISKWIHNYTEGVLVNDLFYGSNSIMRDFIHVDDITKINMMFLDFYIKFKTLPSDNGNMIFDVGSGVPTSFEDVAKQILRHTKGSVQYIINPYDDRNYQFYTKANISIISGIHEWVYMEKYEPMTIADGVKKTFDDIIFKNK